MGVGWVMVLGFGVLVCNLDLDWFVGYVIFSDFVI